MKRHPVFVVALCAYVLLTVVIVLVPKSAMTAIGVVGLVVAWVGAVSFPIYFHLTVRWWENFMGQHVMAYSSAIAMALTNTVARVIFPDLPGRLEAGTALMWLITGVIWWRIFAFRKAQKDGGRLDTDEPTAKRD